MTFDLKAHLLRQMAFSHATYGPGKRTKGVLDHIQKETKEVGQSDGSPYEWVDLVILSLDGMTRSLAFNMPGERRDPLEVVSIVCEILMEKQSINEARVWPDWRTQSQDGAIEHDRTGEEIEIEIEPKPDCDFYYFKPSGKWKYSGEGFFPVLPRDGEYHAVNRETIMNANCGGMPGIVSDACDLVVLVIPKENCQSEFAFPRMLMQET